MRRSLERKGKSKNRQIESNLWEGRFFGMLLAKPSRGSEVAVPSSGHGHLEERGNPARDHRLGGEFARGVTQVTKKDKLVK